MPILTPTKWDPAKKGANASIAGSTATSTSYNNGGIKSVAGVSSGKYYLEVQATQGPQFALYGFGTSAQSVSANPSYPGASPAADSIGVYGYDGTFYQNNSTTPLFGRALTVSDIVGLALDADAHTLAAYLNGVLKGTATTVPVEEVFFSFASGSTYQSTIDVNFGQTAFAYSPPAGFFAGFGVLSPAFKVSGIVLDDANNPAVRVVRAYSRNTGALFGSTTSSPSGAFSIITIPSADPVYVVALDDEANVSYNALIYDRIIPVPE